MPINLDNIKPKFDVQLSVTNNSPSILFNFARPPGTEVIAEFNALKNHSFVEFLRVPNEMYQSGAIELATGIDSLEVAEAIATCLENDHGLKVNRLQCISSPGSFTESAVAKFGL